MKTFGPKRAFLMLAALLLQATIAIGAVNITVQPASVTSVADGAKITLSVTATSTNTAATFSYQWFKLNGAIPEFFGAASSKNTLVFASAKTSDAGSYQVVVTENGTNPPVTKASDLAQIIVNVRPKITVHPVSPPIAIREGSPTSFSVTLDGTGATPFTYTWQKKVGAAYVTVGTPVSKPDLTDTLNLTNLQLSDAGTYRVSVTNLSGIIVNSKDVILKVNSRPVILTPHSITVTNTFGTNSTLRVVAGGNAPFTYRWLKNDVVIPKTNSATLVIKGTDNTAAGVAEGPGNYKVQIVNAFTPNVPLTGDLFVGSTITESAQPAVVQVIHRPKILTQPLKATVDITSAAANPSLSVVMDTFGAAGNEGTLQYQWQKDGKNIADTPNRQGTNSATLSFSPISWNDRGSYRVIIKNEVGTVTSASAILTVISPPIIISQPVGPLFGATGGSVKMILVAGGTSPLTYAWKFRPAGQALFNDRAVGTSSTLTLSKLTSAMVGEYQCTISNTLKAPSVSGSVLSNLIYLQVDDTPKITQQTTVLPYNATPGLVATPKIPAGQKLHLRVIASGTNRPTDVPAAPPAPVIPANPLRYQWLKNNLPIPGQNAAEMIIDPAQIADTGKYNCIIENYSGKVTSTALTITVSGPPVIIGQPQAPTGIEESTIETTVAVTGSPTIKYKWQKLESLPTPPFPPGATTWRDVPGKTAAKLSFSVSKLSDAGTYKCVITNDFGTTESNSVLVTVTPIPSPTIGPVAGQSAFEFYPTVARAGEKVRIFGQNLNYTKKVLFGGQDATFVIESNNAILATVPGSAPETDTAIEVRTVNPAPAFTTSLFRRTIIYENGYDFDSASLRLNASILTTSPTIQTRLIVPGSNLDVQSVYYLMRLRNPSAFTVFVTGLPSNGKVASLEISIYRQSAASVATTFAGPDGIVRFPNTPTVITPAGTVGANQISSATTAANEYVLIRIAGGWIFSGSNWTFYGPFQLRLTATPTSILTKHSAQSLEIEQVGGIKSPSDGKVDSVEAVIASSSVRFGGDELADSGPVLIWRDAKSQALSSSQVVSSFTMSLESGKENGDDQFSWQVNGTDGKSLLALWVDSATGRISSVEPDGTVHESAQHITPDGGAHRFEIVVNQKAGTWVVYMDGVPLTEDGIPLPTGSRFSEISTVWDLGLDGQSSGASIIFDDFRVEAEVPAR
jgi:hypothetical protein